MSSNGAFFPLQISHERFSETVVSSALHDPLLNSILEGLGIRQDWMDSLAANLIPPPDQVSDRYGSCIKIGILIGIRLMAQEVTFPHGITADDFKAFRGIE